MGWVEYNWQMLSQYNIYATGTTGRLIEELIVKDGNKLVKPFEGRVRRLLSGPLGGDQQIGAMIAEGKINMLIFFCDNLIAQGHQNDVSALSRLASLYNIAYATNRTTADMLLTSTLLTNPDYSINLPDCISAYTHRELK